MSEIFPFGMSAFEIAYDYFRPDFVVRYSQERTSNAGVGQQLDSHSVFGDRPPPKNLKHGGTASSA
jgi:hypothetical protein